MAAHYFLYTTGEYLLNARTVNDLIVQSEERRLLWQALRERSAQTYGAADLPGADVPPEVLALLLGIREEEESYGEYSLD